MQYNVKLTYGRPKRTTVCLKLSGYMGGRTGNKVCYTVYQRANKRLFRFAVARQVSEDATSSQCQSRYVRSLDPNIKRGEWSEEEDGLLKEAVSVFGRSWMDVCVWVPGRNNEQCRERWQELDKHKESRQWTEEDDEALLQAREAVGGSKWVEIGRILGRNNNVVSYLFL